MGTFPSLNCYGSITRFGKQLRLDTLRHYYDIENSKIHLLLDTQNCGLHMRRECRERFLRHGLQKKPHVNDPGMLHGTCLTYVPWCMSGSQTPRWRGKRPCATSNFTYLVRYVCVCVCVSDKYLLLRCYISIPLLPLVRTSKRRFNGKLLFATWHWGIYYTAIYLRD